MNEKNPAIGQTGKDKVTGFEGVITGFAEYFLSESAFLIEDGTHEKWISADRIEVIPK